MDSAIQRTISAVDKAFQHTTKRFGLGTDKDLNLYQTLTMDDFQDLTRDFGETNVLQYIQEMEKRKLQGE